MSLNVYFRRKINIWKKVCFCRQKRGVHKVKIYENALVELVD
jgi:hypothetical protein